MNQQNFADISTMASATPGFRRVFIRDLVLQFPGLDPVDEVRCAAVIRPRRHRLLDPFRNHLLRPLASPARLRPQQFRQSEAFRQPATLHVPFFDDARRSVRRCSRCAPATLAVASYLLGDRDDYIVVV